MNADSTPMNADDFLSGCAAPIGSVFALADDPPISFTNIALSAFIGVESAFIGVPKIFEGITPYHRRDIGVPKIFAGITPYRPLKSGLALSRKARYPIRKSSVP